MMSRLLFISAVMMMMMMMGIDIVSGQDCTIPGQERRECASACQVTCTNYRTPFPCPAICVVNGCQCPEGSVINEETNACVVIQECPNYGLICPNVTGGGDCVVRCNGDNDCEGDLLCCTNGCGLVCTEGVDMCAGVSCPSVACVTGGVPVGECCTVCGCLDPDQRFVKIGDTFMNDCNTCTCDSDNSASCTEIACPPGQGNNDDEGSAMVANGYTLLIVICIFISSFVM